MNQEKVKSNTWLSVIFSDFAFNSDFVANIFLVLFKSEIFANPKISDLLTDNFSVIFASTISFLNLL